MDFKQMFIETLENMQETKLGIEKFIEDETVLVEYLNKSEEKSIKKLTETLNKELESYKSQVKQIDVKIENTKKLINLLETNQNVADAISLLVVTFGLFGAPTQVENE